MESEGGTGSSDEPDCPIIVNELLCYATDKLNVMPPDSITQICVSFYNLDKIIEAKELLFSLCEDSNDTRDRYIKRQGPNAAKSSMGDILNMILRKQAIKARFVAADMSNLPAVSFNNIDVSVLLSMIESMQTEIQIMKNGMHAQATVCDDLKEAIQMQVKRAPATPDISPISSQASHVLSSTPKPGLPRPIGQLNAAAEPWTGPARAQAPVLNMAAPRANPPPIPPPIPARKTTLTPAPQEEKWTDVVKKPRSNAKGIRIGTGRHTLKAATYAKEGRSADVFVTRLAPEVTTDDILRHLKQNLSIEAKVDLVKATNNYSSFHINAKCQFPRKLIDTDLWPEGAIVRWWRTPRPKAPSNVTIYHDAPSRHDIVSDETMRNMTMPRISLSLTSRQAGSTDADRSVHSEEKLPPTTDLEKNPEVSDKTLMDVQYNTNQDKAPAASLAPPAQPRSPIRTRSRTRVERSRSQIDLSKTGSN